MMTSECSIFLDTNALIHLINSGKLFLYREFTNLSFHTFEKCIYEYKNGLKRHFINSEFLLRAIKNPLKKQSVSWEEKQAASIIDQIIYYMALDPAELDKLITALKTSDLRYEFGIALEHEWTTIEEMEELFYKHVRKQDQHDTSILRLKQFYKLIRARLNATLFDIDQEFGNYKLNIILYEQVFCSPRHILEFRSMMRQCYLPSEDLEIIFSAMCNECQLFVTDEHKIIRHSLTLGLNHWLEFIHLDELEKRLMEWMPKIALNSPCKTNDA